MTKTEGMRLAMHKKANVFSIITKIVCSTCVLAGIHFFCVMNALSEETEDMELVESFDAARESWLQNVSFYGTYVFKWADFYTEEDARTKNIGDKYIIAKGIISKLNNKYRLQVLYTNEPDIDKKSDDLVVVSNRSSDVIANKDFYVLFHPEQGTDFESVGSLNKKSAPMLAPALQGTPFCLFLDPIAEMPSNTTREPKYTTTRLTKGLILLSFTGNDTRGNRYIKTVTVKTDEKIPIITKISLSYFEDNGNKLLSLWERQVVEWRICEGISVPSCVRIFNGPLKIAGSDKVQWPVSEWRSADIDQRPPTNKDFVLQLPSDEGLVGMKSYPKNGLVDIDTITDDDFVDPNKPFFGHEYTDDIEPAATRYIALRLTLIVIGAILIIWGLILKFRRKK